MIGRFAATLLGQDVISGNRPARRSSVPLLVLAATMLGVGVVPPTWAQRPDVPAAPAPASKEQPTRPDDLPPPDEPTPGAMTMPRSRPASPAPFDRDLRPAAIADPTADPAADDAGKPALPGATLPPGGANPNPGAGGDSADSFALKPDRLAIGKQQVRLSVEVRAASVINLGKETPIRIVVTNDGSTDAYGVSVTYQLPDSLQFVSSEVPPIQLPTNPQIYTWNKAMMAAGGEWSIGLKVVAKDTKGCEHVASVMARAGSKANTTIQEPKLKVDALATARILKGGQANVEITIRNDGTGPAHDVNVQVRLSDGLRLGEDDVVEQTIDVIEPGKSRTLDSLRLDTVAKGQQKCDIAVSSPDVNFVADAHRITRTVEVTSPELDVALAAQDKRYTGQAIDYKLSVKNTGTAPARAVLVSVALPQEGGKLRGQAPDKASWSPKDRKLFWKVPQLAPNESFESRFVYDTSTPRLYRCTAEAVAGPLRASKQTVTDVTGIADLDLKVSQTDRVIDVGKTTYYDFVIKNVGTKEATQIACSGKLINLKVKQAFKGEATGDFQATEPRATSRRASSSPSSSASRPALRSR